MTKIGLLSDTHSFLDPKLGDFFKDCDQIWHAGDIGKRDLIDQIKEWNDDCKIVYGNIDGHLIRAETVRDLWFKVEDKTVFMTHIGGYPGRYNRRMKQIFAEKTPDIFVCGHSHILKVMYDKKYDFLHINPGACGNIGFHQVRTAIRFNIDGTDINGMELIELGHRGMVPRKEGEEE